MLTALPSSPSRPPRTMRAEPAAPARSPAFAGFSQSATAWSIQAGSWGCRAFGRLNGRIANGSAAGVDQAERARIADVGRIVERAEGRCELEERRADVDVETDRQPGDALCQEVAARRRALA